VVTIEITGEIASPKRLTTAWLSILLKPSAPNALTKPTPILVVVNGIMDCLSTQQNASITPLPDSQIAGNISLVIQLAVPAIQDTTLMLPVNVLRLLYPELLDVKWYQTMAYPVLNASIEVVMWLLLVPSLIVLNTCLMMLTKTTIQNAFSADLDILQLKMVAVLYPLLSLPLSICSLDRM